MKLRHLLATLSLAVVAGSGVAAGLSNGNAQKAEAVLAGDTFYFEINNTWKGSGTDIWAHFFSGSNPNDVKLTCLSGNIYTGTLPNTDGKVLFTRGNSSAPQWDWNNETYEYDVSYLLDGGNNYMHMKYDWWYNKNESGDRSVDGKMEYRPNLSKGDAFLRGTWENGWADLSKAMTYNGSTNSYSIEGVALRNGQEIKMMSIADTLFARYHDATSVNGTGGAAFENNNVVIKETASYNITVTFGENTCVYTVDAYVDEDLNAAIDFAEDFVDDIYLNCPYNYKTSGYNEGKDASTLANQWALYANRYNYQLSEKAEEYLTNGDESTADELNLFAEVYDYVYGNYAGVRLEAKGGDFANRNPAIVRNLSIQQPIIVEGSSTTIIAVVSTVSLVAIGGFFFFRRKRA